MGVDALVTWALNNKVITFPAAVLAVIAAVLLSRILRSRRTRDSQSQHADMRRARVGGDVTIRQEQTRRD